MDRDEAAAKAIERATRTGQALLSAWLGSPEFQRAWVPDPSIFPPRLAVVAATCAECAGTGTVDFSTIIGELLTRELLAKAGGIEEVEQIEFIPDVVDPWRLVEELSTITAQRTALDTMARLRVSVMQEDVGRADFESAVVNILEQFRATRRDGKMRTLKGTLEAAYENITNTDKPAHMSTGTAQLDKHTGGGFRPGFVWLMGASTNWGKTTWALQAADLAMRSGRRVGLVTLEDDEELLGTRFFTLRANVNALQLSNNNLTREDWASVQDVIRNAEDTPFLVNAIGRSAEAVASSIRSLTASEGIEFWIVDYLQRLRSEKRQQDRRNEVTYAYMSVADAIKAEKCAGMITSQITSEQNKAPHIYSIRDSKDASNAADVVVLGYIEEDKDEAGNKSETRWLLLDKNKGGPKPFRYELRWSNKRACFLPDETHTDQQPELGL